MCGIAGFFGKKNISQDKIKRCLSLMKRRGPDASNFIKITTKSNKNLVLLHSRLSIIDLDKRSDQPYRIGNNFLSYNGEIYNYKELKKELLLKGISFETNSDTEVLIKLINFEGIESLKKCEGMWAFAYFDYKKETLILSRDRFGEKPLYFFKNSEGIYFGSEPKFIFTLLGRKLKINYNQIFRYLVNGYKSLNKSNENFFLNLKKVSQASCVFCGDEINIKKYWSPNFNSENNFIKYNEAIDLIREKLFNAIKIRLRSDVPIAFCLSGGIDSNSIISIAKKIYNYDVHGFTIMNTDKRYEEKEYVLESVKKLGIKHTKININRNNFLKNLKTLISYHDSPISTINYYSDWELMSSVHDLGYKVCLSGTAADEMFTGYYDHHNFFLQYLFNTDINSYKKAKNEWYNLIKPIVRNQYLQNPDCFIKNPNLRDHIFLDNKKFSKFLKNEWIEDFKEERYSDIDLRNRMINEMFHENVPVILHEDDLNSMYFSIENRSPFLDKNLYEACLSLPTKFLIKSGYAKNILREAVRNIAPTKILNNPRKVGFNVPIEDYLDLKSKKNKEEILDTSKIFDIIKKEKIEELFKVKNKKNSESKFLFYFLSAKFFLEENA